MKCFVIEVSEGVLRTIRKAITCVKVSDERFTQDELIVLRDVLVVINEDLEEDNE